MNNNWKQIRKDWLEETSLPEDISFWAIDSISRCEKEIISLEESIERKTLTAQTSLGIENRLKEIKKAIKAEITKKENSLDDLSLNTPNSYKLQLSVPSNLNYLMKAWAAAEGRDLSSIALHCLETGLRSMKSKGAIPVAALKRYDDSCEKRIALAEANKTWEKHEELKIPK